jgi:hypothetical protein
MKQLILFGVFVYASWRVIVNFYFESEAHKQFGVFRPNDVPNYGYRGWGWVIVAVLAGMGSGFFSGGSGSMCRYC